MIGSNVLSSRLFFDLQLHKQVKSELTRSGKAIHPQLLSNLESQKQTAKPKVTSKHDHSRV